MFRFIAQKSDELFEGGGGGAVRTTLENDHTEDHSALLPPLETFGHLNESIKSDDRLRHFFNVSFFISRRIFTLDSQVPCYFHVMIIQ